MGIGPIDLVLDYLVFTTDSALFRLPAARNNTQALGAVGRYQSGGVGGAVIP